MPENCQFGELVETEFKLRQAGLVNEPVTEAKARIDVENQRKAESLQLAEEIQYFGICEGHVRHELAYAFVSMLFVP